MSKKQTVVYKVVEMEEEGLYSSCFAKMEHVGLRYAIMQKTVPAIGKLFVFKELKHAINFAWERHYIFKCVATNVYKTRRKTRLHLDRMNLFNTIRYWKDGIILSNEDNGMARFVYFADSVTPIEIVKEGYR